MSTLAHLTIQNFAGASFVVDVDLATTSVYELKQTVITIGKGKSVLEPVIAYNGHVLQDDRTLAYYNLEHKDIIHIRKILDLSAISFTNSPSSFHRTSIRDNQGLSKICRR